MKKFIVVTLLVVSTLSLYAKEVDINLSKGIDQEIIKSLTPKPASKDVEKSLTIKVEFTVDIDSSSVQKNNIKLKELSETNETIIKGDIKLTDKNTLSFTPKQPLQPAIYEVEIKSIKAIKSQKDKQIKEIKYRFVVTDVIIIHGHTLPPEPDKALNDSTLLGIDSNNNGVRDDVERWIYETYKDKHPIYVDIAMQAGRAYKKVLEMPERAKEIYNEIDKAAYCEMYYKLNAKYFNEPTLVHEDIDDRFFRHKIYFNTKERMDAYIQYDTLLSGDSYTLPKFKERKAACDFNTSKYGD